MRFLILHKALLYASLNTAHIVYTRITATTHPVLDNSSGDSPTLTVVHFEPGITIFPISLSTSQPQNNVATSTVTDSGPSRARGHVQGVPTMPAVFRGVVSAGIVLVQAASSTVGAEEGGVEG
jgi:hypothetical protein